VPPGPSQAPGVSSSAPTCFRHPNRETYVSCVRCGRPACPDCLRSAAVGQQCVECVREGNKGTRVGAAPFGGTAAAKPVVTWTLIALNAAMYIAEIAYPKVIDYGQLVGKAYDLKLHALVGVAHGEWYRTITSAFLHYPPSGGFGVLHILFNMYALYIVGPALERMLGHLRFIAVYLVSALGGSVLFYLLARPYGQAIGASGAIFGLFGAWFVLARRLRLDARMIVGLIVINLVISFAVPNIAWWQGHIGGLIAGAALTAAYVYAPRQNRSAIQLAATVGIVALLIAGVALRDHQLVHATIIGITS
jgi:membrane associated rhomboid family serine protease